jgi:hypothetical protein
MNDAIRQLAEAAGFKIVEHPQEIGSLTVVSNYAETLEKFADLVAQVERKICADLCENMQGSYPPRDEFGAKICAGMIKARGIEINPNIKELVKEFKHYHDVRAQFNLAVNDIAQECIGRIGNLKGFSGYIDGKIVNTPDWNAALKAAQDLLRDHFESNYKK